MFAAVRYKSIDYAFEASTRCKLTMNLFVLPLPDLASLCSHTGNLPDIAFRKPWTRAKVKSSCRLAVSGSMLDDLCTREVIDIPEKITSYSTQRAVACTTSQTDVKQPSWCETFSRATAEKPHSTEQLESLYLDEPCVDFLPQFQKLPSLNVLSSRLKTLPVLDPLMTLMGESVSKPCVLRDCVPWEDMLAGGSNNAAASEKKELFSREPLPDKESLLLDVVLEFNVQSPVHPSLYRNLQNIISVVPEVVLESSTCLEYLRTDKVTNVQIELYDMPVELTSHDLAVQLSVLPSPPACLILMPHMELDVPLVPTFPSCLPQPRASNSQLQKEILPPEGHLSVLLPDGGTAAFEALWKVEKHHHAMLDLLLAEPQMCQPIKLYQPVLEAARLMDIMWGHSIKMHRGPETDTFNLNGQHDLVWGVEKMAVDQVHMGSGFAPIEDFSVLSFTQIDYILTGSSEDLEGMKEPKKAMEDKEVEETDIGHSAKHSPGVSCNSQKMLVSPGTDRAQSSPAEGSVRRKTCTPAKACEIGTSSSSATRLQKDFDPLHTFMMLRSQQWREAVDTACPVERAPTKKLETKQKAMRTNLDRDSAETKDISSATTTKDTSNSQVIYVDASESQRQAYRELQVASSLCLSSSNPGALSYRADFHSLSSERILFFLKQQEIELNTGLIQGELNEREIPVRDELALLHALVTARDLLVNHNLSVAVDYLDKARVANAANCLDLLWTRLRVLQYLSWRNREPNPKAAQLEKEMRVWWLRNGNQNNVLKVLVIITMATDNVTAEVHDALDQITGAPVAFLYPEEKASKVDGQRVTKSVQDSWCVVVSSQHVGPCFPWDRFSMVVEYDGAESSAWALLCRERGISHMAFHTIVPIADTAQADCTVDQNIPFVLLAAGSLLSHQKLLQTLESTYGVTLLERSPPPSYQMWAGAHGHSVVTVDESTAVFMQELEALRVDDISGHIVQRLTALSLQYICCWVLLHCGEELRSGYRCTSEVFTDLSQIHSEISWFGQKIDMDVKVLYVTTVADLAKCICHIAHQTLMTSGRDPVSWLDRDWLSALPSLEEKWLMSFPSISPLVAQLMLHRAPDVHWLLGASLPDLQGLLPEVPLKVIKLFSETAALFSSAMCQSPEPPAELSISPEASSGEVAQHVLEALHSSQALLSPGTVRPEDFSSQNTKSTFSLKDETVRLELGFRHGSGMPAALDHHFLRSRDSQLAQDPEETGWSFEDLQNHSMEGVFQGPPQTGHDSLPPRYTKEQLIPHSTGPLWRARTTLANTPSEHRLGSDSQIYWNSGFISGLEGKRRAEDMEKDDVTEVIPHETKRKLTYERIPGRGDGQTRLMFS